MADRVADLTVDEFKQLIRETVIEVFTELTDEDDEELEFQPAILDRLRTYLRDKPSSRPLDDVARELGLDE
jgi:hypothetical protein